MILHFDLIAARFLELEGGDLYSSVVLQAYLRDLDRRPRWSGGLLARLVRMGQLQPELLARVARWTHRYLERCRQAVLLRLLEGELGEEAIHDLLVAFDEAPLGADPQRVLHEETSLSSDQVEAALEDVEAYLRDWSARTIERARAADYAVTPQPMPSRGPVTEGSLKISALFRSERTAHLVRSRRVEREASGGADDDPWLNPSDTRHFGLLPGYHLGPYTIRSELGRGGMARIYLAEQGPGEFVAVKVLRTECAEPEDLDRFEREAAVLRRIQHPAVLQLLDDGVTESGTRYLVFPAIAGETLQDLLSRERRLPVPKALGFVDALLDALEAIHAAGVVHKDLKPENLMLNDRPEGSRLCVIDFGLAQVRGHVETEVPLYMTRASEVIGTAKYLSPEQIRGQQASERSDLYAVGVILFQLLTGRFPLLGATPYETFRAHVESSPRTLAAVFPDESWDPRLQELLDRLLEKDPEDRPPDAAAVREVLGELMRG